MKSLSLDIEKQDLIGLVWFGSLKTSFIDSQGSIFRLFQVLKTQIPSSLFDQTRMDTTIILAHSHISTACLSETKVKIKDLGPAFIEVPFKALKHSSNIEYLDIYSNQDRRQVFDSCENKRMQKGFLILDLDILSSIALVKIQQWQDG